MSTNDGVKSCDLDDLATDFDLAPALGFALDARGLVGAGSSILGMAIAKRISAHHSVGQILYTYSILAISDICCRVQSNKGFLTREFLHELVAEKLVLDSH